MRPTRVFALVFVTTLLAALAMIARSPVGLQKAYAVREGPLRALDVAAALDVQTFIGAIPYIDQTLVVQSVDPRTKYQRTIVEGYGNCSNLVFGGAFYLIEHGIDFQIVHFLPRVEFLRGDGHTVLRAPYVLEDTRAVGLLDLLEGGLPTSSGRALDIEGVTHGGIADFAIRSLNSKTGEKSDFYGDLLDRSTVGWIESADVARYFRFLERVHVPFGSEKLEKYFYDGLAVVCGFYPPIQVESLAATYEGAMGQRRLYLFALWVLRVSAIIVMGWLAVVVARGVRALQGRGVAPAR